MPPRKCQCCHPKAVTSIFYLLAVENAVWEKISVINIGVALGHDIWLVTQGQRGNKHHYSYPKLNRHGNSVSF